jgi:ferrochelatase
VTRKVAVVLFNLGGPDSLKAVRPFLFNLFMDPAIVGLPAPVRVPLAALISATRNKEASANYAHMGGRSPIVPETQAQCDALETELASIAPGLEARAFMAMRYWRPFTEDAARAVEAFAPDNIVLLPLYPQYSTTTTASSLKAWREAYRGPGRVRAVCCYPTLEGVVSAHASHVRASYEAAGRPEPVRLLFSAHGLPETVIARGDPYQAQIEACAAAIGAELGRGWDWKVCYQSRVGPMKWLGPSTPEAIGEAAAEGKGVVICPIAFVSEHVETLVELDRDYAALAQELGCRAYVRVPALGVEPAFISGLARVVADSLGRSGGLEPGSAWRCGAAHAACPYREECAA